MEITLDSRVRVIRMGLSHLGLCVWAAVFRW